MSEPLSGRNAGKFKAVDRLVLERVSQTMSAGGIGSAMASLVDEAKRKKHFIDAREWVANAITAVRLSPGGAAFGDDEQIAQRILDEIAKKRAVNSSFKGASHG